MLVNQSKIDIYTKKSIIRFIKQITQKLANKHDDVWKGVELNMGGKIIDYEEKTIYKSGFAKGEDRTKQIHVINMLKEGLSIDLISRICQLTAEQITTIGKNAALL